MRASRRPGQRQSAASIHDRLLARAKQRGEDFNLVLSRYATERWLYRLSVSPAREKFVLKGAWLFMSWFHQPHRPTRDADFLGFESCEAEALRRMVEDISAISAEDGLRYDLASMRIEGIREDADDGGWRVLLHAYLERARCPIQLDIGFGDVVTPAPREESLPTLLDDQPAPRLLVYPRESVIAEKLEALVKLGIANSRMKDFFDLLALVREGGMNRGELAAAIAATFARRKTALPEGVPLGLSETFAQDVAKRKHWESFLRRNGLSAPSLEEAIAEIRAFLEEPLRLACAKARRA